MPFTLRLIRGHLRLRRSVVSFLNSCSRSREVGIVAEGTKRLGDVSDDEIRLLSRKQGTQFVLRIINGQVLSLRVNGKEFGERVSDALGQHLLRSRAIEKIEITGFWSSIAVQEAEFLQDPDEESIVRGSEAKVLQKLDREPLRRLRIQQRIKISWYRVWLQRVAVR
ncbi:MAG TPA: hypothetical protein VK540_32455 [Polyangiaceae bacterium]|nr:hypothetical protein [Polyangiaceae bacterium]